MYRRLFRFASIAAAICLFSSCQRTLRTRPAATPAAKLVVLIVIDQLPSWKFSTDRQYAKHGIRRLIEGGLYFENGWYPYANTSTAPGHAAIGSGAPPNVNGIFSNYWYDPATNERKEIVEDAAYPLLPGGPNPSTIPGESSRRLKVDGVTDVLKRERPGSQSIAVALKDRAAILMLGRKPDLALFYDEDQAAVTTTRFYADALPAWVTEFNKTHALDSYLSRVWEPLDRDLVARATGIADDTVGERRDFHGLDGTFPHPLVGPAAAKAFGATPWATDLVFELAESAIIARNLGKDDVPDLLGVGLSSHDIAGHVWGQESWERFDLFLRLDQRLEVFLQFLDKQVGRGNYSVLLTGDHGATPLVELSQRQGKAAYRVSTHAITDTAEQAVASVLGTGDWVRGFTSNTFYMMPAFDTAPAAQRDRALDAMVSALRKIPGVGFVERTDRLFGKCERHKQELAAAACYSIDRRHSGVVFVSAAPLSLLAPPDYMSGTNHGSATPEDRGVPIIVYGAGVSPETASASVAARVSTLRVAPTLAALLGITKPPAATGDSLVRR